MSLIALQRAAHCRRRARCRGRSHGAAQTGCPRSGVWRNLDQRRLPADWVQGLPSWFDPPVIRAATFSRSCAGGIQIGKRACPRPPRVCLRTFLNTTSRPREQLPNSLGAEYSAAARDNVFLPRLTIRASSAHFLSCAFRPVGVEAGSERDLTTRRNEVRLLSGEESRRRRANNGKCVLRLCRQRPTVAARGYRTLERRRKEIRDSSRIKLQGGGTLRRRDEHAEADNGATSLARMHHGGVSKEELPRLACFSRGSESRQARTTAMHQIDDPHFSFFDTPRVPTPRKKKKRKTSRRGAKM